MRAEGSQRREQRARPQVKLERGKVMKSPEEMEQATKKPIVEKE